MFKEMKVALTTLALVVISCNATEWQSIKSPLDKPHYREVISRLIPGIDSENQNRTATGKIVNGTPAQLGQFPYQVYIYSLEAIGTYLCGGSVRTVTLF